MSGEGQFRSKIGHMVLAHENRQKIKIMRVSDMRARRRTRRSTKYQVSILSHQVSSSRKIIKISRHKFIWPILRATVRIRARARGGYKTILRSRLNQPNQTNENVAQSV